MSARNLNAQDPSSGIRFMIHTHTWAASMSITDVRKLALVQHACMPVRIMVLYIMSDRHGVIRLDTVSLEVVDRAVYRLQYVTLQYGAQ